MRKPLGSAVALHPKWDCAPLSEHDVAIVNVAAMPKGNLGFDAFPNAALLAAQFFVAGYPINAPQGTQECLVGNIASLSAGRCAYSLTTFGGLSGAPLWLVRPDGPYVVGVHTDEKTASSQAVRFTEEKVTWIESFCN